MNKYLVKVAEAASVGDIVRGVISPAWQENHIAREHGKKTPNWGQVLGTQVGGEARQGFRSTVEGGAGKAVGHLAGAGLYALTKGRTGRAETLAPVATLLGGAGAVHGWYRSTANQANEAHAKFAAVENLVNQGVDFDEAVDLVKQAGKYQPTEKEWARQESDPGWMNEHVAAKYGKTLSEDEIGLLGIVGKSDRDFRGKMKGYAGGALGIASGIGLGRGLNHFGVGTYKGHLGRMLGLGAAGLVGGAWHGAHASNRNQIRDAHAKYSEGQTKSAEESHLGHALYKKLSNKD